MKRLQKIISFFCALCLMLLTSACSIRAEISDMLIFGGVGIDMENGMVTLTVQAQRAGMDETMIVLQAQGRTTSEAMSNLSEETGKVIVTSQNLVFAVGQSFMEQGRAAQIDSCARQLRIRPDVLMLLSETTAADIMNARDDKGELIPLENLRSICQNGFQEGKGIPVRVMDWYNEFYGEAGTAFLPVIGCQPGSGWIYQGTQLLIGGEPRLLLDRKETGLYAMLSGESGTQVYTMATSQGKSASGEITAHTEMELQTGETWQMNFTIEGTNILLKETMDPELFNSALQQDCMALLKKMEQKDCLSFFWKKKLIKTDSQLFREVKEKEAEIPMDYSVSVLLLELQED